MSAIAQIPDVFTVELPWSLQDSPFTINELELDIVKLQQHIIDDLQVKLERAGYSNTERTKEIYDAMKAERDEIILARDRAFAETDVMRESRNKALAIQEELEHENHQLHNTVTEQKNAIEELKTQLRHKTNELAGVPKLIENKVSLALSTHNVSNEQVEELEAKAIDLQASLDIAEQKRAKAAEKNITLDASVKELTAKNREQKAFLDDLTVLCTDLLEAVQAGSEGVADAEENYRSLSQHIDDLRAFASIITSENEQVKNDNLYMRLLKEFDETKPLYSQDGWLAYHYGSAASILPDSDSPDADGIPAMEHGLTLVLNTNTGMGHLAYVDTKGSLCIPATVTDDIRIPKTYITGLTEGIQSITIPEMSEAIERTVLRTKHVVHNARLLDSDWCQMPKFTDITKAVGSGASREKLERIIDSLDRAKRYIPTTTKHMERVNKRYGTAFTLKGVQQAHSTRTISKAKPVKRTKRKKR